MYVYIGNLSHICNLNQNNSNLYLNHAQTKLILKYYTGNMEEIIKHD